jgi:hypothetical protein
MSERRLDENTAQSELDDSDFAEENEDSSFAAGESQSVASDRTHAMPESLAGMDPPTGIEREAT